MSAALRVFSGCSFAQPLGLAPLALCPKSRNVPQKAGLTYIFSPPFHARSLTLHFARATFRSHPAVAVRLPQHRHFAPRKKNSVKTPFFYCGAWGCSLNQNISFQFNIFWIPFHKNFIGSEKNKKINKKKVKVSSSFKKRKFKPCGFSKKSPPYILFRIKIRLISKSHFRTNLSN
jgi:hypothetical protein